MVSLGGALILALRMHIRTGRSLSEQAAALAPTPADLRRRVAQVLQGAWTRPAVSTRASTGDILKDHPPNSRPVTEAEPRRSTTTGVIWNFWEPGTANADVRPL